jgi:hypothetical protein
MIIAYQLNRFIAYPTHQTVHTTGSSADFPPTMPNMTHQYFHDRHMPERFMQRWLFITTCIAAIVLLWQFLPSIKAWFSPRAAERTVTPRGDLAADERSTIELFENSRDSVVYISAAQLVRDVLSWLGNRGLRQP